jgi:hypothetical protein
MITVDDVQNLRKEDIAKELKRKEDITKELNWWLDAVMNEAELTKEKKLAQDFEWYIKYMMLIGRFPQEQAITFVTNIASLGMAFYKRKLEESS